MTEIELDDEYIEIYRAAFVEGYDQGIADGRMQGREAALFFVKVALADNYDETVRAVLSKLEKDWE